MASLKWVLLALLVVMADTADVITAIRKALVNRKDLTGIHRYLGWADKLYLDLPVSGLFDPFPFWLLDIFSCKQPLIDGSGVC